MKLGFIGYGELGRQIAALVQEQHAGAEAAFFDDEYHAQKGGGSFPFAAFREPRFDQFQFHVCLGYKHLKKNWKSCRPCSPPAAPFRLSGMPPHL